MTDPLRKSKEAPTGCAPPGWVLATGLLVGAAVVLGAATLGWAGVVVIVAVLVGACSVLLRWSRWPRPARRQPQGRS